MMDEQQIKNLLNKLSIEQLQGLIEAWFKIAHSQSSTPLSSSRGWYVLLAA